MIDIWLNEKLIIGNRGHGISFSTSSTRRALPSAAERNYHQALAIAKLQNAKLFELQASISLARLWCKQGRRGEARDLLAPIYGWFTEGFDARDLKEAKALLEELNSNPNIGN